MGLWHRVARARLAAQVIRRLRHAGVTDARYRSASFTVRFTRSVIDAPTGDRADTHPAGGNSPDDHPTGDDTRPISSDRPDRGGEPVVIPLDALLANRARHRRVRRAQIDRYVAGYLGTPGLPDTWAEARPLLRPVLRGTVPARDITAPLRRAALPLLSEFVVVDQPETMTYVSEDQLAPWGVTAAEVFAAARANLAGAVLHGVASEPVVVQFRDDGDAYWTSHLLLDGWLARLAEQVGGTPVAFAPERGTLLVTADGSAHLPGLFARAETAFLTSPRALTPMAYISDHKGQTRPYAAPPGHPLHDCVRRAGSVLAMHEYANQAEDRPDAAPLELTEDGLRTRTTWSPGLLLPQADEIRIGDETHAWQDVESRLTAAPGVDPPRYHLTD